MICGFYLKFVERSSGRATSLRAAGNDDQQVEIAGRKLLEGFPLRFRSLAFHLTRKHVMYSRSDEQCSG